MTRLPHRRHPCTECPWRKDTPPGQFTAERYEALQATSEQRPGDEPGLDSPMFACHRTAEGREQACAGWLAAVGHRHLGVRLAVMQQRLPVHVLEPQPGWPTLFETYAEMAERQAQKRDDEQ